MTITYEDIRAYHEAGQTAAEIAASLNAITLYNQDAFITGGPANTESVNLLHLLSGRFRVLTQTNTQAWQGPLVDAGAADPAVQGVLELLFPYLQVKDSQVYCSASPDAAGMVDALTAVVQTLAPVIGTGSAQDVQDAVDLLTGGKQYSGITEAEVQAVIDQKVQDDAVDALESDWATELNDTGINAALAAGDRAALIAALNQAATNLGA